MITSQIKVAAARDLGPQFVNNPHRMIGQDGAFSIPFDDGSNRTLWYFGDTLVGSRVPNQSPWMIKGKLVDHRDMTGQGTYEQMINNTALLVPKQTGENGIQDSTYLTNPDGRLKNLLPLEGKEHHDWDRIWCQHGISIGEKVVLSFIQVRMLEKYTGPLPIGFEIVGSGLAVGSVKDWQFQRVRRNDDHILWRADQPHFGVAFLKDHRDGVVYVYGTINLLGLQRCFVARVSPDKIDEPQAYEYYTGPQHSGGASAWSNDIDSAIEIFAQMPSELSVSYNAHLGAFLAVHSLDLSGHIVGRTAPNPWGPWSKPVSLWHVKEPQLPYERPYPFCLIYSGKEHPSLSRDNGRTIYLTYIEFEEYFPHLVEVTLS